MKRNVLDLQTIKSQLKALQGKPVEMKINRGRKKIDNVVATITDLYPSVFTIVSNGLLQTFSYFDIMCGNVIINK